VPILLFVGNGQSVLELQPILVLILDHIQSTADWLSDGLFFVDRYQSNSTGNLCPKHVSFDSGCCDQHGWVLYVLNLIST